MTTTSIPVNSNQANKVAACEQLHALALYASSDRLCVQDVVARALELTKPFLPDELQDSIDTILHAQAIRGSEWCVSAREVA